MKLLKRTCKKSRQELLNKVLTEELESLRKKCFPRKKRNLLFDEVIIREANFETDAQAGEFNYEQNKNIIEVSKGILWSCHKMTASWIRRDYYRQLKDVVRHELIHAFVRQEYEDICSEIQGKCHDGSPIFLTVLNWVNGVSGHDCFKKFGHTDSYMKSEYILNTFEELDNYIVKMIMNYKKAINDIEYITNIEDYKNLKCSGLNAITNTFIFSPRDCGFIKNMEIKKETMLKVKNRYTSNIAINRTWEIGCNVAPQQIAELYNRKQDCKATQYVYSRTMEKIINGEMKVTKILKNENNFGKNIVFPV